MSAPEKSGKMKKGVFGKMERVAGDSLDKEFVIWIT